ncbi:baculoviral IAP repeat-containing protein 2-like isoform X1 [Oratosquilla oratoria]|uniref:baculoviral IAP repeat-containing protein 2-like isoform X1 n=1 Tax=Oratosquilla oratoria TaxID=337810 RepID=UPI003F76920F
MGDVTHDVKKLSEKVYRLSTYGENFQSKDILASAGFYYTRKDGEVRCFECGLEIDAYNLNPAVDLYLLHRSKKPNCSFAKSLPVSSPSKKFNSYDSLRYEKERLATFIDWPVEWLSPADLAKDGFYYLRTEDHVACVFCRGIVGSWDPGDTARGEHKRHFPQCPFVKGHPVGNVPLEESEILARIPQSKTPAQQPSTSYDVCGTGRHMPGSYPECKGSDGCGNDHCLSFCLKTPQSKEGTCNFDEMGLPQHSGPKRKDFLTKESRVSSFFKWPERVQQKPEELADAGFFYCGLSDHVRCFHCGGGLRNWENDDKPWEEHVRWYPDCNFVLLKKGQDFIDKVRREKPPYYKTVIRSQPSKAGTSSASGSSSKSTVGVISDAELERLLQLDITKAAMNMGFPPATVKATLRRKLEQTGTPFFSLEPCIEAVLQYMEEETRQTLLQEEAVAQQASKMNVLHQQRVQSQGEDIPPSSTRSSSGVSSASVEEVASDPTNNSPMETTTEEQGASSSTEVSDTGISTTPLEREASSSTEVSDPAPSDTPLESSDSPPSIPNPESTSSEQEPQHLESEESEEVVNMQQENTFVEDRSTTPSSDADVEMTTTAEHPEEQVRGSQGSLAPTGDLEQIIHMADEVIVEAEEALRPKVTTSGPPSLDEESVKKCEDNCEMEQPSTSSVAADCKAKVKGQTSKELVEELERLKESRMCKVCMDCEMDVVFLPCAHMVVCASCAVALTACPICRQDIKYTIKPIVS